MTNLEYMAKYYPDTLIDLATNGGKLAIDISSDDGDRICECSDVNCSDCRFNKPDKSCEELAEKWFKEEYDGTIDTSETSDNNEGGISW